MQIDITAHDILVNPEHREYAIEKLEALGHLGHRIDDPSTKVKVEVKKMTTRTEGKHIECQITMSAPRALFRAEVHANQVNEAIDLAVEKLKTQITRYGKNPIHDKGGISAVVMDDQTDITFDSL